MSDPNFWNDADNAKKVSKEATDLKDTIETYESLSERIKEVEQLWQLALAEEDASLEEEIQSELDELSAIVEAKEIELMLSGEYDGNNAILTLHAGAGGTEAQDWTQMLLRMFTRWGEQHHFKVDLADILPGDDAGVKSATVTFEGKNAYGMLRAEKGVHRLVRISPFDAAARRHTSFSAVDVMPEIADDVVVDINMDEVRVDYFRASGAGGQHVNKTSSAVRMTHLPTGIVVQCQNERSQMQNREQAMRFLRAKLFELELEKREQLRKDIGGSHEAIEWGSQIRSYVFHPYTMVKDHRTGVETGNVQAVMDGDLDPFIEGYLKQKMKKSEAKHEKISPAYHCFAFNRFWDRLVRITENGRKRAGRLSGGKSAVGKN